MEPVLISLKLMPRNDDDDDDDLCFLDTFVHMVG